MRRKAHQHWTYPLEIAVDNAELVKVGYTRHDLRELDVFINHRKSRGNNKRAYQSKTVCFWIGPRILYHIPVGHPLCENAETVWIRGHRNAEQR